ncbi:MAG: hypothetical protein J1F20_04535 [Muribaculaceae bacterium]|nr:hypothetical protein [Muribaculaceae bacterium]
MSNEDNYGGYSPNDKPHTGSLNEKINQMRSERREEITRPVVDTSRKKRRGWLMGIIAIIGVVVLGAVAWLIVEGMGSSRVASDQDELLDGDDSPEMISLQQQLAQSEFENLEKEFAQYEMSQQEIIVNDTIKQQLQQKYEAARLQVEELRAQLRESANKSSAEIQKLNDQIRTLRELLKHYLEEIDRLNKENEQLRNENTELRESLNKTTTTLVQAQQANEKLTERMTLAEKLNVTGVSLNMLNKKDKTEKKIKNAKKFVVSFTIPQNNSTPVGTKTIYAVITTPEGTILDGGGSFSYDGSTVNASAQRQIDYGGEEIGGLTMYYDIRNALSPGTYSVQLFCDGYALMSHPLEVNFKN